VSDRTARGLFLEAVLIVGSILLAFAIDAWWEDQELRQIERDLLAGLHADFLINRDRLANAREVHEADRAAAMSLQELTRPGERQPGVTIPPAMLIEMITWRSYDPLLGTLNSAIASGNLRLIQNSELRSALAGWIDLVEDLNEEELIDRDHAERFQWIVYDYIPMLTVQYDLGYAPRPSTGAPDWEGLLANPLTENFAVGRTVMIFNTLNELDGVEAELNRILGLLEQELGPNGP
jgi:hypothetical protein